MWPTPRANERQQRNSRDGYVALSLKVKTWATPAARDWRSGKASQATMERNSRPLNEQMETGTGQGGALSPAWVETLMGYPPGWTALEGGAAGPPD